MTYHISLAIISHSSKNLKVEYLIVGVLWKSLQDRDNHLKSLILLTRPIEWLTCAYRTLSQPKNII